MENLNIEHETPKLEIDDALIEQTTQYYMSSDERKAELEDAVLQHIARNTQYKKILKDEN